MRTKSEIKSFLEENDFSRNYQRIHLGHDLYTPGSDRACSFDAATAPIDLEGKTYLDIGCMWGAMAFLAEDRGAEVYGCDMRVEHLANARAIAGIRDSDAFFFKGNVMESNDLILSGMTPYRFDVVSMFNVIHHLPLPFLALSNALNTAEEYFIIEFPTLCGRWDKISTGDLNLSHLAMDGPYLGIISKETGLYFTEESMTIAVNWFGDFEPVVSQISPYRKDRLLMTFRRS